MRDTLVVLLRSLLACALAACAGPAAAAAPPQDLRDTGLFADAAMSVPAPGVIAFTPQYTLWSDGTSKRRWIRLPPGTSIDASNPDAWVFPRGTRLWKEFAYGARVETRYIELGADGQWRFATYRWSADGRSATLAGERGAQLAVADAPAGRYALPSRADCLNCHAGARSPVLGFGALQLGELLPELVRRGLVRRAPPSWRSAAPQIAAANEAERAARGYLHANCGHCHFKQGVPVPLVLAQDVAGTPAPEPASLARALERMASRNPLTQMPPLGTRVIDPQGLAVVQAWSDHLQSRTTSPSTRPSTQEP